MILCDLLLPPSGLPACPTELLRFSSTSSTDVISFCLWSADVAVRLSYPDDGLVRAEGRIEAPASPLPPNVGE